MIDRAVKNTTYTAEQKVDEINTINAIYDSCAPTVRSVIDSIDSIDLIDLLLSSICSILDSPIDQLVSCSLASYLQQIEQ